MSSSPLNTLSLDARNHILEFLPLHDCFRYSQVSQQCIREVLPGLQRRRSRQLCQRHAYQLQDPCRLIPLRDISTLANQQKDLETNLDCLLQPINGNKDQWHIVPSVAERIKTLYHSLPPSHPSNNNVRLLMLELMHEPQLLSDQGIVNSNFQASLQELATLSKAYRLHELILSQATIASVPPAADRGFTTNAALEDTTGMSLTTTLEQYIGDVLTSSFCMGHCVGGLVEGPTTHQRWTRDLLNPQNQTIAEGPIHWYRRWVFLHSTLLRTFPMTRRQLSDYKLSSPLCGILGSTERQNVEYIQPHYCFLGTGTSVVKETTKVVESLQWVSGGPPLWESVRLHPNRQIYFHTTRWNQFGPLGPSFRGRDNVQRSALMPGALVGRLEDPKFGLPPTWLLLEEGRHYIPDSPVLSSWFTEPEGNDDVEDRLAEWMVLLPRECYKNRPMTVQPPLVTIDRLAVETEF